MQNRNLTTYDGAPLVLSNSTPPVRALTTQPLSMSFSDVTSATASNLTGGVWSASIGAAWDHLPEVPPDGERKIQREIFLFPGSFLCFLRCNSSSCLIGLITLNFGYQVNLMRLQSSLKFTADASGHSDIPFAVSRCSTPAIIFPLYAARGGSATSSQTVCLKFLVESRFRESLYDYMTHP